VLNHNPKAEFLTNLSRLCYTVILFSELGMMPLQFGLRVHKQCSRKCTAHTALRCCKALHGFAEGRNCVFSPCC
jgi:hypothetical protein